MSTARGVQSADLFTRNPRVEEAPLQDELMLFDPEGSKFYVLNRTMAFVWRQCDGGHTLSRMLEALQGEFEGVEPGPAEAELRQALGELVSLGLVVDSPPAVPVP